MCEYKKCNGCIWLMHEALPKGAGSYRCMNPDDEKHRGRTVAYSAINAFADIQRPAWCEEGKQT